jgi:endonuclease/exonuclease/phosphatase family metal-dependent hydrolase
VLAGIDADVICLQEVDRHYDDRSEGVDQAVLLSQALDMQLAWGPTIDEPRPDGPARQYGNALLSRLPILVSDVHPLPGTGEPRTALRTMLELDGATLWVTTTHLTVQAPAERAAQVAVLAALHTEPMAAGVVVGDFNARAEAPELALLRERFTDAWTAAGSREDQAGWRFWNRDEGDTYPAHAPHRRIDHVWLTGPVTVAAAHVADGGGASDHLPLVVDLAVTSGV